MSAPYVPLGVASPLRGGEETARRLGLRIPDSVEQRGAEAVREWVASIDGLRFRIPAVDPGEYTYVIYCKPCGGTLIGHPERGVFLNRARLAHARGDGEVLRILAEGDSARAHGETSSGIPWPVAVGAGGLGLISLVALGWISRARGRPRR
jgi:hypothetical protein